MRTRLARFLNVSNSITVCNGDFSTSIRACLPTGWQRPEGDPDTALPRWLLSGGVPAGWRKHSKEEWVLRKSGMIVNKNALDVSYDYYNWTPRFLEVRAHLPKFSESFSRSNLLWNCATGVSDHWLQLGTDGLWLNSKAPVSSTSAMSRVRESHLEDGDDLLG